MVGMALGVSVAANCCLASRLSGKMMIHARRRLYMYKQKLSYPLLRDICSMLFLILTVLNTLFTEG